MFSETLYVNLANFHPFGVNKNLKKIMKKIKLLIPSGIVLDIIYSAVEKLSVH